jgi:AcrR family transcriptional regulator
MQTLLDQTASRIRSTVRPRKLPKQARARKTVEAIIEAAGIEFACRGYARASTNSIAEIAGVSIGSLYEYYPGKASILSVLVERQLEESLSRMSLELARASGGGIEEIARALACAATGTYEAKPALSRVLIAATPRVASWRRMEQVSLDRVALIKRAIEPFIANASGRDHCAFAMDCIAESIIHRSLLFSRGLKLFRCEEEITKALIGFLREKTAPPGC